MTQSPNASLATALWDHKLLVNRQRRRYYLDRAVYNAGSWRKLLTGRVRVGDILRALGLRRDGRRRAKPSRNPKAEEIAAGFRALADRGTELLFLYSAGDPGLEELEVILEGKVAELAARETVQYSIVEQADHMFTALASQEAFLSQTGDWLGAAAGAHRGTSKR